MVEPTSRTCPRCLELEAELKALTARLAELKRKLAAASKTSRTSSKPPSSDIVKPPSDLDQRGKQRKRKRGGQPGHPRHDRVAFEENELDHVWHCRYESCPCCEGPLMDAKQEPARVQQVELVERPVRIDEHRQVVKWCPHCRQNFIPRLPAELERAGLVGPRLTALVGWLKGVCHMSFSSIRKYFRDVIGVPISRGMLAKVVQKVSQSLKDPYDELMALISQENLLNNDETGHKDHGRRLWTWCFRAQLYTLFKIAPSRGSEVLLDVLGEEFHGLIGCDYFSAYRKYMRLNENVALQFCLAHFIRDVKFLVEHPDARNRKYGSRLIELLCKLFHTIHRRDAYPTEAGFRVALARIGNNICWEGGMYVADTAEARNLAERLYRHVESYFRFITIPDIEPTNNLAEQAIRFVAIHRRMTQGTRGDNGQRWFERICTAVVTCEQQGPSAFHYLCQAVVAFFQEQAAPSLMPSCNTS